MTTNQEMSGIPVISIGTGERLGTIDQIVLEPEGRKIAAFTVQSTSRTGLLSPDQPAASWLLAEDIHAAGPDAVTIDTPDLLRETIERRDYLLAGDLVHRKVVTEGGSMLGEIASIHFDQPSLAVTNFEISKGLFKSNPVFGINHMINIGNELIIVDDTTGIAGTEPTQAAAHDESDTNQTVVGDVTAGDTPGSFQVQTILDGEQAEAER